MTIKRLCVLAVVFMAVLADTVCADVVIGNEFFYRNKKKTQRLKHNNFIVDSPDGYVIQRSKPGKAKMTIMEKFRDKHGGLEKLVYKNGERLHIESVYIHKGKYWGITPTGHGCWPVWVPMDYLLTLYTPTDFEIDNKHKFYEYTGNYDAVKSAEKLVLWQWPGSDREKSIIKNNTNAINFSNNKLNNNNPYNYGPRKNKTYKDNEGREWGAWRGTYYSGEGIWGEMTSIIDGWICLSDPENSNIPAFNPTPKPVKWSPDNINKDPSPTLIIILVMILAAGTAVLARIFWKPHKTKPGGENDG